MKCEILFDNGEHRWIALGRDPERPSVVIDTNEYLIVSRGDAVLLDPGGTEIFAPVLEAVSAHIAPESITTYFGSHQDPDIISSLPLWMAMSPRADVFVPRIWTGFLAHFGFEYTGNFRPIPDEGCEMRIGTRGYSLTVIPAHYCHASGNFSVYDPAAKVLFSGDIGAALLPNDSCPFMIPDFNAHVTYMEGFHRRWMPSNEAKNDWIRRVRLLDVQLMCPQHGAIFRGEQVGQFLNWFEALDVGSAVGRRRDSAR